MTIPKKVDTHQHVNWHQRDIAGLVRDLDENEISYAWLLTWYTEPGDAVPRNGVLNPINVREDGSQEGITLEEIVCAKERFPGRFIAGYCPNPRWEQAPIYLRNAHLMHGVQVCGEWKYRVLIDDPRCLEIFRMAGTLGMPVVLHLDVPYLAKQGGGSAYQSKWYGGTIENLERAMQACPDTVFIGHAPGFWREISGDARSDPNDNPDTAVVPGGRLYRLFDDNPNLYADLSARSGLNALRRCPEHATMFITRYADRLLFGRDRYGAELDQFLSTLPLDAAVRAKVYFRNAERLVAAPAAPPPAGTVR